LFLLCHLLLELLLAPALVNFPSVVILKLNSELHLVSSPSQSSTFCSI
jgi:hypothetical protein